MYTIPGIFSMNVPKIRKNVQGFMLKGHACLTFSHQTCPPRVDQRLDRDMDLSGVPVAKRWQETTSLVVRYLIPFKNPTQG